MAFDFKGQLRKKYSDLSDRKKALEKEIRELDEAQTQWASKSNELGIDDPKHQGHRAMLSLLDQERERKVALLGDIKYNLDNLQPLFDIYAAEDQAAQAQAEKKAQAKEEAPPEETPPKEETPPAKPKSRARTKKTE